MNGLGIPTMSLAHSPAVVTAGLVLALDAANTKSYPGSGTAWNNLSSAASATLVNGPTFSSGNQGSLVFDGVNEYTTDLTTVLTDSFWQSDWTASFWVNFDTLNTTATISADKTLLHHGTSASYKGLHLTQRNSKLLFGLYNNDLTGVQTLNTGTWYNIVFTLNNTSFAKQIYINGALDNSHTGGGAYTGTGSNTRLCGPVLVFGSYFDGFFSNCNFYNRVLTFSEISQNYNAMRGRFGI